MKKNKTQFTINLVKTHNGYLFDSFVQGTSQPPKPKKVKNSVVKNPSNRTQMNRIARELAINIQATPIIEEPQSVPLEEPSYNRNQLEFQMNEQIEVENKREADLPQCPAKWFDLQHIHQIEEKAFPQFFDAKSYKTPELYMKYRNFIINLYQKNPGQYLTKISCRRILRGDANTIMKIHSFLQQHGLINFGLSINGNYLFLPSKLSKCTIPQSRLYTKIEKIPEEEQEKIIEPINRENITHTLINKNFSKTYRGWCQKCQNLCGIIMYRKKSEEQTFLCLQCYQGLGEKEAQQYVKTDIVKRAEELSNNKEGNKSIWVYDENMKLLDFMSQGGQNWTDLKDDLHQKRTYQDIVLQFLQFPITNFDPIGNQNQPLLSSQPKQAIDFLQTAYDNSVYRQPEQNHNHIKSEEKNNLKQLISLLCHKYQKKLQKIKKVQQMIKEEEYDVENMQIYKKKLWKGEDSFKGNDISQRHGSSRYNGESEGRIEEMEGFSHNQCQDNQFEEFINSNIFN